jgi:hypothetical protein
MAQEEFGVMGADFLASLGRKLLVPAKDQIRTEPSVITEESREVGVAPAKDRRSVQAAEMTAQSDEVELGVPKDQRLVVPG